MNRRRQLTAVITLISLVVLGAATAAGVGVGSHVLQASAETSFSPAGSWLVTIEGAGPEEGNLNMRTVAALHADGTMIVSGGQVVVPAPPGAPVRAFYTTMGIGRWEATGERSWAGIFFLNRSDAEGNFMGTTIVYPNGVLSEDGLTFTGTSDVVIQNPAGETIATRSDVVTAERVAVERVPAGGTS